VQVRFVLLLVLVRLQLVVLVLVLLKEGEEVHRNLLLPLLVLNADILVLVELEGFLALYLLSLRCVEIVQLIRLYLVVNVVCGIRLLDRIDRILGLVRIRMERVLLTLVFLHVFWVL